LASGQDRVFEIGLPFGEKKTAVGLFCYSGGVNSRCRHPNLSTSRALEIYSRREFEVKLGIRSATQIRYHMQTINLTCEHLLDSDLRRVNWELRLDQLMTSAEAAIAQMDNGLLPGDKDYLSPLLENIYSKLESLPQQSPEQKRISLQEIHQTTSQIMLRAVQSENEFVKQIAEQVTDLNTGNFNNSQYFYILSFVFLCSFIALALQIYFRDRASLKLVEVNRQLDEEKMHRFQLAKMSTLGEMAAGVAHEVNNPLGIIFGYLSKIRRLASQQNQEQEIILTADKIELTANRISKIVKGLLDFSRDGHKDHFIPVLLVEIIDETLMLSQARLRKRNIKLILQECPKEVYLNCKPTEISQIILNLINNSADEIEPKPDPWIEISFVQSKNVIQIWVTDSGSGVKPEIQDKIFNPFFTSKEVGKGVGLGLSISKGIAEDHLGRLYLDAACPHTRFVLEVPLYQFAEG
jgi:C4-dicarboxylate-specific signal transduction histidine kinase